MFKGDYCAFRVHSTQDTGTAIFATPANDPFWLTPDDLGGKDFQE